MKAIKKLALVLAALATVFAFASCSDDDDDDDGPSAVTTWLHQDSGVEEGVAWKESDTVYFYGDGTFKIYSTGSEGSESFEATFATGTYTGDTTKAGATITLNATKIAQCFVDDNSESTELVDNTYGILKNEKITISSDGKSFKLDGDTYTKQ